MIINICKICNTKFTRPHNPNRIFKYCSIKCMGSDKEKGRTHSIKMKGHIPWSKGRIMSVETRHKMSIAGRGKIPWNKGKTEIYSKETLKKNRLAHLGQIPPNKGEKCPERSGKNSHLWRGGITPLYYLIRNLIESKKWSASIFERDNYTCRECYERGGKLEAHHLKKFSLILQEFLQQYNQFSPIDDKETLVRLAITYEPFWDTNNGITLCKECHYQIGRNEKGQFTSVISFQE